MKMDRRDYAQMYAEWIMYDLDENGWVSGLTDKTYYSIQNKIEDFLDNVILSEVM